MGPQPSHPMGPHPPPSNPRPPPPPHRPKDSKARRHDKLKKMMEEVENKTYRQDPAYSHTDSEWGDDQWAFEKHFPTWSKMRDDMEDYHEFISEHINVNESDQRTDSE